MRTITPRPGRSPFRSLRALACGLALAAAAPAQLQVQDVGLTLDGGFGQDCGPVTCTPLGGGMLARGTSRQLFVLGATVTPYALAIGLPGPCLAIPNVGNVLLLGPPVTTLAIGLTSAPPFFPTPCGQGIDWFPLDIPLTAPVGLTVRFQAIGVSNSGAIAFSPAIEATVG